MAEQTEARQRRWIRWAWRGAKIIIAALLVVAIVWAVWTNAAGERAKREALAKVRSAGLPTSFAYADTEPDWDTPGTRFALAAFALSHFPDTVLEGVPILTMVHPPQLGVAVPPEMTQRLAHFSDEAKPFRTMLAEVAQHQQFDYNLNWWDRDSPDAERYSDLRRAARTAHVLSLNAQARGDGDEALQLLGMVLHLNQSFRNEQFAMMALVRVSVQALVRSAAEKALSRTTPSDGAIAALERVLAASDSAIDFDAALEGEVSYQAHHLTHEVLSKVVDDWLIRRRVA